MLERITGVLRSFLMLSLDQKMRGVIDQIETQLRSNFNEVDLVRAPCTKIIEGLSYLRRFVENEKNSISQGKLNPDSKYYFLNTVFGTKRKVRALPAVVKRRNDPNLIVFVEQILVDLDTLKGMI